MKPIFYASQIPVYLGYNPYQNISNAIGKLRYVHLKRHSIIVHNPLAREDRISYLYQGKINVKTKEELNQTLREWKEKILEIEGEEEQELHWKVVEMMAKTSYGSNCEKKILDLYDIRDNNNETFRFEDDDIIITGKCDGFIYQDNEKILVEIKSRISHLFQEILPYENIQIQVLLLLTKSAKCLLIESYKDKIKEYWITPNQRVQREIINYLKIVGSLVGIGNEKNYKKCLSLYLKSLPDNDRNSSPR